MFLVYCLGINHNFHRGKVFGSSASAANAPQKTFCKAGFIWRMSEGEVLFVKRRHCQGVGRRRLCKLLMGTLDMRVHAVNRGDLDTTVITC